MIIPIKIVLYKTRNYAIMKLQIELTAIALDS